MSLQNSSHQDEADPSQVLDDVLGSHARLTRERIRRFHQLVNIRRLSSQTVPAESRSSVSDAHADELGADGKGSDLDYIADMDWGSPPSSAIPIDHADTPLNPQPMNIEGNVGFPQSPKPLLEFKDPGPIPSKAEVQLRVHIGHDLKRILINWRLFMTHREVELQLAEKQLAARYNPYNELVQHVTYTPVERSPSPPPAFPFYPQNKTPLFADASTEPVMPLSLIPTERLWAKGGRLETRYDATESDDPLTGFCSAATGFVIDGDHENRQLCGKPCQAAEDPEHGGICESTEHHPGARVWVCDDHDKSGRHEATHDLLNLATSLRHYACADCCWNIENDETGQYLSGTGWHVFEVNPLPDSFDPTITIIPPSATSTPTTPTRSPPLIVVVVIVVVVADRRLCAPHRLEAMTQLHRWHPSTYALENSAEASQKRRDIARAWAASYPPPSGQGQGQVPAAAGPQALLAVGASCPLCPRSRRGIPVDQFGFRGPLGREGQTVAWVCRACLGVVTGAVASPGWVENRFVDQRFVHMGPVTQDYPMYPFPASSLDRANAKPS
ncbi:hypothetical protein PG985_005142 [Apiospora marii]|uniref:uncharacterized protein n=1 Tax=Apiospora marii TaxID=335849 RepID=UPI003130501A